MAEGHDCQPLFRSRRLSISRLAPDDQRLGFAAGTLEALFAGPPRDTLTSALPRDVRIRASRVTDGVARIDLSRDLDAAADKELALAAITQTMTRLPGVKSVAISVEGRPLASPASRTLLYYPSDWGLMAVRTDASTARGALTAFLAGPPTSEMTGMPPDVRLLTYDYDSASRLLSLGSTYTSELRALALEKPDRTRMLLLGLIATLTAFDDVHAVRLDFGGQSRLGLGECSDLLRSPQQRPALLNDERLLD